MVVEGGDDVGWVMECFAGRELSVKTTKQRGSSDQIMSIPLMSESYSSVRIICCATFTLFGIIAATILSVVWCFDVSVVCWKVNLRV